MRSTSPSRILSAGTKHPICAITTSSAPLSHRANRPTHRHNAEALARLNVLSHDVLVSDDVDEVAVQLSRLLVDIEHHRQRLHDLAYDDVEIEIGGSE